MSSRFGFQKSAEQVAVQVDVGWEKFRDLSDVARVGIMSPRVTVNLQYSSLRGPLPAHALRQTHSSRSGSSCSKVSRAIERIDREGCPYH
jgi:hypothetical protein